MVIKLIGAVMSDIKQEPKKGLKAWHYIALGAVVFIAIGSLSDKSKPSKPSASTNQPKYFVTNPSAK